MPGLPMQQAAIGHCSKVVSEVCCTSVRSIPVNCGGNSPALTAVTFPACALVCKIFTVHEGML